MGIDPNRYYTGEEVENLIRNSVAKSKRRVIENWKEGMKLVVIITMIGTMIITALANMLADKIKNNQDIDAALDNFNDREIVMIMDEAKEVYREPGKVAYAVDHDTYDAADYLIKESDNFHLDLFLAYKKVGQTREYDDAAKKIVMDELLQRISSMNDENNPNHILDYASFEDYVVKHGFVDKDGKADYKKYRATMEDILVKLSSVEDQQEEHGMRGLS